MLAPANIGCNKANDNMTKEKASRLAKGLKNAPFFARFWPGNALESGSFELREIKVSSGLAPRLLSELAPLVLPSQQAVRDCTYISSSARRYERLLSYLSHS